MRVPILTYHALNASGWDYRTNDHVALADDLELLQELDYVIAPLRHVAEHISGEHVHDYLESSKCVGLSWDDGTNHDFVDYYHPDFGYLKSLTSVLVSSALYVRQRSEHALTTPEPRATSFVIVSPYARQELDHACIAGRSQWRDDWWLPAAMQGALEIANHSWDHLHPALTTVRHSESARGNFATIRNEVDADLQIRDAQEYLVQKLGHLTSPLFAYPYGQSTEYLVHEYFPKHATMFLGAFTTDGDFATDSSNRWRIPRFVCGEHWTSRAELGQLLQRS